MILEALYYFVPAYFANLVPPLVQWIPFLNKPINKKYFGNHKTWRGFVFACLFGLLFFYIQKLLYQVSFFQNISIINYSETTIWFGLIMGFGAIFGDLIKSYFKRKAKVAPGKSWIPFDQMDYAIGGLLFSFIIFIPSTITIFVILIMSSLLPPVFHYTGYLLGINKDKI